MKKKAIFIIDTMGTSKVNFSIKSPKKLIVFQIPLNVSLIAFLDKLSNYFKNDRIKLAKNYFHLSLFAVYCNL